MTFLSVVTRSCGRARLLARNRKSLATQTDPDYEHIIIIDNEHKGLHEANKSLVENKYRVNGQYVLILDDDDYISDRSFIKHLKNVIEQYKVATIFFKAYRKPFSDFLPSKRTWGKTPILGEIGSCCFIVENAIWKKFIGEFAKPRYGDYYFIKTLFDNGCSTYWLNRTMIMIDKVGGGDMPRKVMVSPDVEKVYPKVTVVLVNYCTKELTNEARRTMQLFYPKIPIILIDNGSNDESTLYVKTVGGLHSNITAVLNEKNIGHGLALNQGVALAKTRYVLFFDSDSSLKCGGLLEAMLAEFEKSPEKLYAIGWLRKVDRFSGVPMNGKGGMDYIHPHAAMIDREKFLELELMESSGAPCTANMRSALAKGFELRDFPIRNYVNHLEAGTRRMFHGHWKPGVTVKAKTWRADEHYPI